MATASATLRYGSMGSPPNLAAYQVCTAAWLRACHGGCGHIPASRAVARSSSERVSLAGSKKTTSTSRTRAGSNPSPYRSPHTRSRRAPAPIQASGSPESRTTVSARVSQSLPETSSRSSSSPVIIRPR
ncbi:hypothetical protein GAR06_05817 [Micromonospora saelicesensis]|nr:hypothetical protein GAR06_05817 [Micromonospora saelicesensis]